MPNAEGPLPYNALTDHTPRIWTRANAENVIASLTHRNAEIADLGTAVLVLNAAATVIDLHNRIDRFVEGVKHGEL